MNSKHHCFKLDNVSVNNEGEEIYFGKKIRPALRARTRSTENSLKVIWLKQTWYS
jgi:hypothetical protein